MASVKEKPMMIPVAQFIEDVESFLDGKDPDVVVRALQERYQQYKLVEAKLLQNRVRLQAKLPDIKKALDTVKLLVERRDAGEGLDKTVESITADFELADGVFAKANVMMKSCMIVIYIHAPMLKL